MVTAAKHPKTKTWSTKHQATKPPHDMMADRVNFATQAVN